MAKNEPRHITCKACKRLFAPRKPTSQYCSRPCFFRGQTTRVTKNCYSCGKVIEVPHWQTQKYPHNYCSRKCVAIEHGKQMRRDTEVSCKCCGKRFVAKPCKAKRIQYCSQKCHYTDIRQRGGGEERKCVQCGRQFWCAPARLRDGGGVYCSRKCMGMGFRTAERRPAVCPRCNRTFESLKQHGTFSIFCSQACKEMKFSRTCAACGVKYECEGSRADSVYCSKKCCIAHKVRENSNAWTGGTHIDPVGRKNVYTSERYVNVRGKKVRRYRGEHRIVVESIIGRRLSRNEIVFHVNWDRGDNRADNLYLFPSHGDFMAALNGGELPKRSNLPITRPAASGRMATAGRAV